MPFLRCLFSEVVFPDFTWFMYNIYLYTFVKRKWQVLLFFVMTLNDVISGNSCSVFPAKKAREVYILQVWVPKESVWLLHLTQRFFMIFLFVLCCIWNSVKLMIIFLIPYWSTFCTAHNDISNFTFISKTELSRTDFVLLVGAFDVVPG